MTGTNTAPENHGRVRWEPARPVNAHHRLGPHTAPIPVAGSPRPPAEVIAHLVVALSRYLRYLREDSKRVPAELEHLSIVLAGHVRQCQDVPTVDLRKTRSDPSAMAGRLLLTKSEAAEQLGVSLRTIERLISAGRLPLVHVEGAARVRVADLETYVQGLETDDRTNPSHAE